MNTSFRSSRKTRTTPQSSVRTSDGAKGNKSATSSIFQKLFGRGEISPSTRESVQERDSGSGSSLKDVFELIRRSDSFVSLDEFKKQGLELPNSEAGTSTGTAPLSDSSSDSSDVASVTTSGTSSESIQEEQMIALQNGELSLQDVGISVSEDQLATVSGREEESMVVGGADQAESELAVIVDTPVFSSVDQVHDQAQTTAAETRQDTISDRMNDAAILLEEITQNISSGVKEKLASKGKPLTLDDQPSDIKKKPSKWKKLLSKFKLFSKPTESKEKFGTKGDLSGQKKAIAKALMQLLKDNPSAFKGLLAKYGVEDKASNSFFSKRSKLEDIAKQLLARIETASINQKGFTAKTTEVDLPGDVVDHQTPANDETTVEVTREGRNTNLRLPQIDGQDRGTTFVGCKSNQEEGTRLGNGHLTSISQNGKTLMTALRHAVLSSKKVSPDTEMNVNGTHTTVRTAVSEQLRQDPGTDVAFLKKFFPKASSDKLDAYASAMRSTNKKVSGPVMKKMAQSMANINKAKDAARMTALKQLKSMSPEDRAAVLSGDKPLKLNMTSVSLLTPVRVFGKDYQEAGILKQQLQALKDIAGENQTLDFVDDDGNTVEINVDIKTAGFNFGVNEGSDLGRSVEFENNSEAWQSLKEDMLESKLTDLTDAIRSETDPSVKKDLQLKKDAINKLVQEIDQSFSEFNPDIDTFDIPVKLAILSELSGMDTMFNCKSGKDRTGIFDIQLKASMMIINEQLDRGERINLDHISLDRMSDGSDELDNFQTKMRALVEVGKNNHRNNTGVEGYKTNSKVGSSIVKGLLTAGAKLVGHSSGHYQDSDRVNIRKFGFQDVRGEDGKVETSALQQLKETVYVDSSLTAS